MKQLVYVVKNKEANVIGIGTTIKSALKSATVDRTVHSKLTGKIFYASPAKFLPWVASNCDWRNV